MGYDRGYMAIAICKSDLHHFPPQKIIFSFFFAKMCKSASENVFKRIIVIFLDDDGILIRSIAEKEKGGNCYVSKPEEV